MKRVLVAALLLLASACSRASVPRRPIVVLRFENLTGDRGHDWMERAATRQLAAELGAAVADSTQPVIERQRAIAGGSNRIVHGFLVRTGRGLRLHADLEDAATGKYLAAEADGEGSLLALVDAVARQFDSKARPAGARSEEALASYVSGLDAPTPDAAAAAYSQAIEADPNYSAAYLSLIELQLARQDRAAAEKTLVRARARGDALTAVDRARLDVAAGQAAGNQAAVSQALARLSELTPADANLLRALASSELTAKRFPHAIQYLKKALAIDPGDPTLLNTLGYAYAYSGNFDAAVDDLREYQRLRPQEPNPLDSLAEVHFYYGRFLDAEKLYRQVYEKDATFFNGASLMRAAIARLLSGDPAGAEPVFAQYESARRAAGDPAIGFIRARWDALRGRRADAARSLEATRDPAAECELTVWLLETGDRAGAARRTACGFLTDPRASSFPTPMTRAYALLLAKDFEYAAPLLRDIVSRAPPNPADPSPVMLAWALVETGHLDEARQYLRFNPIPAAPGADPFESLVYPRIFRLREIATGKK